LLETFDVLENRRTEEEEEFQKAVIHPKENKEGKQKILAKKSNCKSLTLPYIIL
jgi:hypothetical protein